MGKVELILLSIFSSAIVGVNYYTSVPDDIDWKHVWIYLILIVMILYFVFMAIVFKTKLDFN